MDEANRYLSEGCPPAFNAEFAHPSKAHGNGFAPWIGGNLNDCLCQRYSGQVGKDNGVRFEKLILQIPEDSARDHYVKTAIEVIRHLDIQPALYPSCTDQDELLDMMRAETSSEQTNSGLLRNSAARQLADFPSRPRLQGKSNKNKSGQSMCYKPCVINPDKSIYFQRIVYRAITYGAFCCFQ